VLRKDNSVAEVERVRFRPEDHITDIRGAAYIEVKWRLVWCHDYAEAHGYRLELDTQHIAMDTTFAAFKATARLLDENGMVVKAASGYGTEQSQDFGDFIEKAETKALGRALAACGFGTQFCEDYDFGSEHGYVVDSPVEQRSVRTSSGGSNRNAVVTNINGGSRGTPNDLLTPRQASYIESLLNEYGQRGNDVSEHLRIFGTLSRATASQWVDQMTKERVLPLLPKAPSAANPA